MIEILRLKRENSGQNLGFASRPFVLCGLPIKRPTKGTLLHERRNGHFTLQVTGHPGFGLPWGQDRLVPLFLATLAIRQQRQTITFSSAAEMLDTFGMQQGGYRDRQDPTVWGGLSLAEQQLAPLYTDSDGEVGTGALWFALYGRKGDPMIETECFTYRIRNMLHDGRFSQTIKAHGGPTRVSAVIHSMPRATVLMENPSATRPLPPHSRAELLKTPVFCLDRSICEWKPGLVKSRIEVERQSIQATADALAKFNERLD